MGLISNILEEIMTLNRKLVLLVAVVLVSALACGSIGELIDSIQGGFTADDGNQPDEGDEVRVGIDVDSSLDGTALGQALSNGVVGLNGIEANQGGATSGQILTVRLTNPGTEEILLEFPCGLVFIPIGSEEQPLMMIQPLSVALPAGATEEVTPYVVCVDIGASAPALASTYTVGYITSDEDLLALAECVCQKELSPSLDDAESIGVQFAAWTIQVGDDLDEIMISGEGAAGDLLESDMFAGMADLILEMMTSIGSDWLTQCGIDVQ